MRIPGANISAADAVARAYQSQNGGAAKKTGRLGADRRFDSVMLSTQESGRSSYEMELRGKISNEVRTATTSGQIAALREQVQNGTYQVDARETARKMLLVEAF